MDYLIIIGLIIFTVIIVNRYLNQVHLEKQERELKERDKKNRENTLREKALRETALREKQKSWEKEQKRKKIEQELRISQKVYRKGDPEYLSNGHYKIDNIDYYSIWRFKRKNTKIGNGGKTISKFTFTNTNEINGKESLALLERKYKHYNSRPDFGEYSEINIYKESDLKVFYRLK